MFSTAPKTSRYLVLISALLMLSPFLFPLWSISLWAPQYPEGLSLQIWASHFTGDVQTVNVLNHYIGMKPIHADSFPELVWFPKIFVALAIAGVVFGILNRKITQYLWLALLLTFSCWALYDFYSWEYRFGHDLSPDAPIQLEGMVYQPPLIGEKVFLNITATSYPSLAGIGLIFAVVFSAAAVVMTLRGTKNVEAKL